MIARWRRAPRGQAATETVLLVALGLCVFGGVMAVARFNPDMLNALTNYLRGYYYVLSLPVP